MDESTTTITTDALVTMLEDVAAQMCGPFYHPGDQRVGALLLTSALAIVNGNESKTLSGMLAQRGIDPVTCSRFSNALALLVQSAGVMFREVR